MAAVRSEVSKEEEKQKSQLLGVASASVGFNTILLMSVTKPVSPHFRTINEGSLFLLHKKTSFSGHTCTSMTSEACF